MLEVVSRRATSADWPSIEALLRACELPLEGAREHLADYRVLDASGELLGCGGLEHHGSDALLRSVAIAAAVRGRALGRALVQELLADARACGATRVYLLTTTAPDYFERLGFERLDRRAAPARMRLSAEFTGACPASAVMMCRHC